MKLRPQDGIDREQVIRIWCCATDSYGRIQRSAQPLPGAAPIRVTIAAAITGRGDTSMPGSEDRTTTRRAVRAVERSAARRRGSERRAGRAGRCGGRRRLLSRRRHLLILGACLFIGGAPATQLLRGCAGRLPARSPAQLWTYLLQAAVLFLGAPLVAGRDVIWPFCCSPRRAWPRRKSAIAASRHHSTPASGTPRAAFSASEQCAGACGRPALVIAATVWRGLPNSRHKRLAGSGNLLGKYRHAVSATPEPQ